MIFFRTSEINSMYGKIRFLYLNFHLQAEASVFKSPPRPSRVPETPPESPAGRRSPRKASPVSFNSNVYQLVWFYGD